MKKKILNLLLAVAVLTNFANAQVPEGYSSGSITLASGTKLSGYIKENMAKKGTISFLDSNNTKTKTYDGTALNSLTIGTDNYTCIKGDFFKNICSGAICFLQKASKTSSKILYSGSEPIGAAGTEGKKGDYFIYNNSALTLLTSKNIYATLTKELASCPTAVAKINKETISDNLACIESFNNCK